jgi:hypothetical protein
MKYQVGDVVKVTDEYGGGCYVIFEVHPYKPINKYSATKLAYYKEPAGWGGHSPPVGDRDLEDSDTRFGLNSRMVEEKLTTIPESEIFWYGYKSGTVKTLKKVN